MKPKQQIIAACATETDECIEFKGHINPGGYGSIMWNKVRMNAHRAALLHYEGRSKPPKGKNIACHEPIICHNRKCINPRHLRWDSHRANMRDRIVDGTSPRGGRNYSNKLTEDQVREIRRRLGNREKASTLAKEYGLNQATVSNIKTGKTWGWLKQ